MSQLKVIMNADTVVPDRDTSVFYLPAVFITSRREVNVVRLPCERREAGVDIRFCNRIDSAALVVLAFQTERIEHLAFVAILIYTPLLPRPWPRAAGMNGVRNSMCIL